MHLRKLALAMGAAGASLALAAPALAGTHPVYTISPTTTYSNVGVAGYYAAPNANRLGNGDHVNGVRSTFELTPAMENENIQVGVELCRFENITLPGAAAVLYAQYAGGGEYNIYAAHGTSANCLAQLGGVGVTPTLIDTVAEGHTVQLEITVSKQHTITYVDSDETTLTGGRTTFGGFTFGFDRAGSGPHGDPGTLTAPADNLMTTMNNTSVRDAPGWSLINRHNLTRLVINRVVDTSTGDASGQVLITPSAIAANSGNFSLLEGNASGS